MNTQKRIQAVYRTPWVIISAVATVGLICLFCQGIPFSRFDRLLITAFFLMFVPYTIYLIFNTTYLTEEGIECYRFGKIRRKLLWDQVGQVCIVRESAVSLKGSGKRLIIITPVGFSNYNKSTWSGNKYLFVMRGIAIWIDNTKENREFIEKHYGEIEDYS